MTDGVQINLDINQFKEFGSGLEQYFLLHYDEKAQRKEKKKTDSEKLQIPAHLNTHSEIS